MKTAKKKRTFGSIIIERLKSFSDFLKTGEPIEKHFRVHKYELILDPSPYDFKKVKETRRLLGVSPLLFSRLLGISMQTLRSWERGDSFPNKMACRFMDEVRLNPDYWLKRIKDSIVRKA